MDNSIMTENMYNGDIQQVIHLNMSFNIVITCLWILNTLIIRNTERSP